jgi:outer membrane protein assembly factor BamB
MMRMFFVSALLVVIASTTSVASAQAPGGEASLPENLWTRKTGSDWESFLGPTLDGKSSEKGFIPWKDDGPKRIWQQKLGIGYCMPAVSRGRLFLFDRYGDMARVTCQKAETMDELWKFEYPTDYEDLYGYNNGPRCMPVVDGDRVYTLGAEGMLHCLRVADGSVAWKIDTRKEFGVIQNFFGVSSVPLVEGDLLLVGIGGSPPESANAPPGQLNLVKPNGSAIVAFDKQTGAVRYKVGDDLASYSSPMAATINGRRWCFYFAREGLLAFDPTTGKQDFHFPWRAPILESVNASNPVVFGDHVFISETYGPGSTLLKVKPGGYDVVWSDDPRAREKRMQTHWNTAIYVDGFLYGSSGRHTNNAELRCIDALQGNVRWSIPGLSRSSLTYVDGYFICLTEYGDLLLFKPNGTKLDWESRFTPLSGEEGLDPSGVGPPRLLGYPAWAAPIISHGLMFVRGNHRLACYEVIPERN